MNPWRRVSFSSDAVHDPDCMMGDDCGCEPACSVCGDVYHECSCPGPTMDEYEYRIIRGVLHARRAVE